MKKKLNIPLYEIYWDEQEIEKVTEVIRSGKYWTLGPRTKEFETLVARFAKRKYGISFNSGTSALFATVKAYDIGPGDEIILPSFTFISSCNVAIFVGAKPVFAEIEDETFGLDPDDVNERITKQTKAIVPTHYGGGACRIKEFREIADDNEILLIEDAAEALGCFINDESIGSFGEAAMYSFCGNKVMTTGEGGMIVTDDPKINDRLRLVRSHGRPESKDYFSSSDSFAYIDFGYNWRISDITAALGIAQLSKLDQLVSMRRKRAKEYDVLLRGIEGLRIPKALKGCRHIYQMYSILFDDPKKREQVKKHLVDLGVTVKVYFDCAHLSDFYQKNLGFKKGDLPQTEEISERILTLPIYPTLEPQKQEKICNEIKKIMT